MKYLYRYFVVIFIFGLVSCETTELDLQENPNAVAPENASVEDLYNSILLNFASFYADAQDHPGNLSRMYMTVPAGFNYQSAVSPTTLSSIWFAAYSEMFPDIDAITQIADERGLAIESGSVKILKAYVLMTLVDLFGNVPFSQAGLGTEVISPIADPGEQVYAEAISLLDQAIAQLSGTDAPTPSNDLFYNGSAEGWVALANTMKLRAALTTRRVSGDAAATINSIVSGGSLIDEATEDFQFQFGNQRVNPNSRHPFYNNHYEIGDGDYLSNYFMFLLRADKVDANGNILIDPRIRYYFYRKVEDAANQDQTTYSCHFSILPDQSFQPSHFAAIDPRLPYCIAAEDGYSGRDHLNGEGIPPDGPIRTSYGLYPAGGQFDDNSFEDTRQAGTTGGLGQGIFPIILSSFVDFMRAEAALTLGTADDARALLESGVRKSIGKVKTFESLVPSTLSRLIEVRGGDPQPVSELFVPSEEDIDEYVNFVLAEFDAADANGQLNVVIREYYIAAWGNGIEAYNMWRRTGLPDNMAPGIEAEAGEFPRSYFYPDVYVNRNANATQKALTDRVFWDDGSVTLY